MVPRGFLWYLNGIHWLSTYFSDIIKDFDATPTDFYNVLIDVHKAFMDFYDTQGHREMAGSKLPQGLKVQGAL